MSEKKYKNYPMPETLLGHLVTRFSNSPENLATESLTFLLNHSKSAQTAFIKYISHLTTLFPEDLIFETQNRSQEDISIPDFVGIDITGKPLVLGEAKFWAGLTENQPVTYIERMIQTKGIMVLFLSPAKRFPTLWPELLRRCQNAGLRSTVQQEKSNMNIALIDENQFLVLISWTSLLDYIRQSLEFAGDREMLGNLIQLQGLCEHMDTSVFLPVQSEELTSNIGARLIQYCDIVDEVIDGLASENEISLQGLRATPVRTGYKRYFTHNKRGCWFEFNPILWNKYQATPLWLGIKSDKWEYDPVARKNLTSLEMEIPKKLFIEEKAISIPVFIQTNTEKMEVINNIKSQIMAVFKLLVDET